jgi:DNA mismatch repair protein MutL
MIKLLPKEIASKIAAGEVIERPVSVVKELLENALDAQATQIIINLEDAGKTLIEVQDNGKGISLEDLREIGQRHATSKVSTLQDLARIQTLGFRGEALASMCAMSTVEIESKKQGELHANKVTICGQTRKITPQIAHKQGTTIRVKNLFSEFPARKKFLKSSQTELGLITDCIVEYVLGFAQIHVTITHNSKQIANYPPTQTVQERFGQVYGIEIAKQLKKIPLGFVSSPSQTKSDKSAIHLFINSRAIKNTALVQAVCAGYGHHLMTKRYPFACIWLTIHPQDLDVNVHPAKLIVKLINEQEIAQIIKEQISQVVSYTTIAQAQETFSTQTSKQPEIISDINKKHIEQINKNGELHKIEETQKTSDRHKQTESNIPCDSYTKEQSSIIWEKQTSPPVKMNESTATKLSIQVNEQAPEYSQTKNTSTNTIVQTKQANIVQKTTQHTFVQTKNTVNIADTQLIYIGQIHKTYALCESKNGLVLIDFHAAHERYNYEEFKKLYEKNAVTVQTLLKPLTLILTPKQSQSIEVHADTLLQLGFDIRLSGTNTALVTTIPWLLHKLQNTQFVQDIIDAISQCVEQTQQQKVATTLVSEKIDAIITKMACIASDKAGDDLTDERMKELLRFVSKAQYAYQCPHGRPTMVELTKTQLEKLFGRK